MKAHDSRGTVVRYSTRAVVHAYLTRHYARRRASIPGNANERAVSRKHPRTFAIAIKRRSTAR